MKKILCFGDSNTYGFNPVNGKRYDKNIRWSGVLANLLADVEVVEAGANNRIMADETKEILKSYLNNEQYDIVIFALGINNIQKIYNPSLKEFEIELCNFIKMIKEYAPKIILMSPAKLNLQGINSNFFKQLFNEISVEKSYKLAPIYKDAAHKFDCVFFDLNDIVEVSQIDGLHFDPPEHLKIAQNLLPVINKIIF